MSLWARKNNSFYGVCTEEVFCTYFLGGCFSSENYSILNQNSRAIQQRHAQRIQLHYCGVLLSSWYRGETGDPWSSKQNKGTGTSDLLAFLSSPSPWKWVKFHWPLFRSVHKGEVYTPEWNIWTNQHPRGDQKKVFKLVIRKQQNFNNTIIQCTWTTHTQLEVVISACICHLSDWEQQNWHPKGITGILQILWDLPILSNLSHGTVGWDGHQG